MKGSSVLSWLMHQHNGLGNADFDEGMKYSVEIKGFDLAGMVRVAAGRGGKERELDRNGRKGASEDDDRSRNNLFQLGT
jgi:hypothetical protein